jgi:hypothetical protein
MSINNEYLEIMGVGYVNFMAKKTFINKGGKISRKWQVRFDTLAKNLGKEIDDVYSILGIKSVPNLIPKNKNIIHVGPHSLTLKEYKKQKDSDDWCWKQINTGHACYRWTLSLCLSKIFPMIKKLEALHLWSEDGHGYEDYNIETVLEHLYLYAFDERMDIDWINKFLPDSISLEVRDRAAKKANKYINNMKPEELEIIRIYVQSQDSTTLT